MRFQISIAPDSDAEFADDDVIIEHHIRLRPRSPQVSRADESGQFQASAQVVDNMKFDPAGRWDRAVDGNPDDEESN